MAEAADLPDALRQLARRYAAQPGRRAHALFPALYAEATQEWLAHGLRAAEPRLFRALILAFHDLYRLRVRNLIDLPPGPDTVLMAPHWRPYFRRAAAIPGAPAGWAGLALLWVGVRAHVRHDLPEALGTVLAALPPEARRAAAMRLRRDFLGPDTDQVLLRSAARFAAGHPALGCDRGLRAWVLRPLWLRQVQGWRRAAWTEAMRGLEPVADGAAVTA